MSNLNIENTTISRISFKINAEKLIKKESDVINITTKRVEFINLQSC